jgi:signal peptidase I
MIRNGPYPITETRSMSPSQESECILFLHTGKSMNPTLKWKDLIEVMPCNEEAIKLGDIVVFRSPIDEKVIAHRVIAIMNNGFSTQGDNNFAKDSWCLKRSAVIGKVVASTRNNKRKRVYGGRIGLNLARLSIVEQRLFYKAMRFLNPMHQAILDKCRFPKSLKIIDMRVAIFKNEAKTDIVLLSGKKLVGRYNISKNQWQISPVYRLFFNQTTFPELGFDVK